jgi:hypothetical protein
MLEGDRAFGKSPLTMAPSRVGPAGERLLQLLRAAGAEKAVLTGFEI